MEKWKIRFRFGKPAHWLYVSLVLFVLLEITGFTRFGVGWGGNHMVAVCHGGVFYVETSTSEFSKGLFARKEGYWLDWTFAAGKMSSMSRYVFVPLWPLLAVTLSGAGVAQVKKMRARPWLCKACRYDLRGTVSARCPECGTVASTEN